MTAKVPLTEVPRLLAQHGVFRSYYQVWTAAIAGKIPAAREQKKWMVAESDIPAIAKLYAAG